MAMAAQSTAGYGQTISCCRVLLLRRRRFHLNRSWDSVAEGLTGRAPGCLLERRKDSFFSDVALGGIHLLEQLQFLPTDPDSIQAEGRAGNR